MDYIKLHILYEINKKKHSFQSNNMIYDLLFAIFNHF